MYICIHIYIYMYIYIHIHIYIYIYTCIRVFKKGDPRRVIRRDGDIILDSSDLKVTSRAHSRGKPVDARRYLRL